MAQFPPAWQEYAIKEHPDLYVHRDARWPRLEIRDGRVALGSVNAAPLGVPGELDFSALACESLC